MCMNLYFSGIGGTAIGPLAMIAHQAGYNVCGSDKQSSEYIEYLKKNGLTNIHIGQTRQQIESVHAENSIDWLIYSSAVQIEDSNHPELAFAKEKGIKATKRDELINEIINNSSKKLVAVAGTHGKTTTTAMAIWLFKKLGLRPSYSVGAKISFGDMGHFELDSEYFIYECDEFDRNFLAFEPHLSMISGIDYDHHEVFPTMADYLKAFSEFLGQSKQTVLWLSDLEKFSELETNENFMILDDKDKILGALSLGGEVNRKNAFLVIAAAHKLTGEPVESLIEMIRGFPGVSRRFERISDNLYSDYAHTPAKIAGCLQMASEYSDNIVVVYEPLTNRRQHYIKKEYKDLFQGVKKLYWVPSYLAREDKNQEVLKPEELIKNMENKQIAEPAKLDDELKNKIEEHQKNGDLIVCLSGGGGGSLDEWVRDRFKKQV
jgi:UDP-N-acetylmuramate--alanine ligase